MNRFNITGRVSQDISLYATKSNVNFAWLSVAVKKKFKNSEGKYDADFIRCELWRNTAEFASKYLAKGDVVGISGYIKVETRYNEHAGHNETNLSLVADDIEIIARKPREYTQEDYKQVKEHIEERKEEIKEDTDPFEMFGKEVEIDDLSLPF